MNLPLFKFHSFNVTQDWKLRLDNSCDLVRIPLTKNSSPLSVYNLLNKLFLQKKLLWKKLSFIATILARTWIDNYPSHKRKRSCLEDWEIIAHIAYTVCSIWLFFKIFGKFLCFQNTWLLILNLWFLPKVWFQTPKVFFA